MNPNLHASDARQKSILGAGDVKITTSVWATISMWNASRILTQSGYARYKEEKKLIQAMETTPVALDKIKYTAAWVKIVLNAIIKKEGSDDFRHGEETTNWPSIKQPEYKRGISVVEITRVIQEHRRALINWAQQQTQNKQKQKQKPVAIVMAEEPVAIVMAEEPVAVVMAEEPVAVPESWEDL